MCGIWGIIPGTGTDLAAIRKFVIGSLIAGTVRGDHGSGMMLLEDGGGVDIIKGMSAGPDLLYAQKAWGKLDSKELANLWAIVGHNRAATSGDISDETAHPFQHDPITLVHNGYISNAEFLPGAGTYSRDRVDSDMLCQSLSVSDRTEILGRIYGAYALAWHDSRDNTLRFVRNSQRPLHMMRLKCGGIAFASEGDMLWWLTGRAGFGRGNIRQLDVDTLLSITSELEVSAAKVVRQSNPMQGSRWTATSEGRRGGSGVVTSLDTGTSTSATSKTSSSLRGRLAPFGITPETLLDFDIVSKEHHHGSQFKFTGFATDPKAQHPRYINAVMFAHADPVLDVGSIISTRAVGLFKRGKKDKGGPLKLVVLPATRTVPSKPAKVADFYVGQHGELVSADKWHEQTAKGCCECGTDLNIEEADEVVWVNNQTLPMCPSCVQGWQEHGMVTNQGTGALQ